MAIPGQITVIIDQALTGGAASLDLTNLTSEDGRSFNGQGRVLAVIKAKAPMTNAAAVTLSPGESNGYAGLSSALPETLQPGQSMLAYADPDAAPVGATNKTLAMSGTGTDGLQFELTLAIAGGGTGAVDSVTFARQMVAKFQQLLLENAGALEVNVDGQDVKYADLEAKYSYWQRKLLILTGRSPTVSRIRLDRF